MARPVPTSALKMRGSWRAKTRKREPAPKVGAPAKPSWMPDNFSALWKEVIDELSAVPGLLTRIDGHAVAALCLTLSEVADLTREIAEHGVMMDSRRGRKRNPAAVLRGEAIKRLVTLCSHFGATPSSRARVSIGDSHAKAPSKEQTFFRFG